MPRTRSLAWSQLKVGILTVAAIVIAAVLIFMVSGEGGFFWQRYHLKARFGDVRGLKEGAPVTVAGVEVGKVSEVVFVGAQVEVVMEVSRDMAGRITTGSHVAIGSAGVLGEALIHITPSEEGTPIPEWGYIPTGRSSGQLSDVADSASRALAEATQLLREVRSGRGTLGKLVTDEQIHRDVQSFIAAAGRVVEGLNQGQGTLGQLVRNPAAYRSLESALNDLNAITRRISSGNGALSRMLNDEALGRSLASTAGRLDSLTDKLNQGEGSAGKLVNDPALYNRLNSVADRLDMLTERLNDGRGTAGQLLHDAALYENMNQAVVEVRNLVADIRKDPRKYLAVRVSIF
jgi:phospholipid/cholesterol/gamma-HCH transport system substrate-binding protein